jgi:hypothetical protein
VNIREENLEKLKKLALIEKKKIGDLADEILEEKFEALKLK